MKCCLLGASIPAGGGSERFGDLFQSHSWSGTEQRAGVKAHVLASAQAAGAPWQLISQMGLCGALRKGCYMEIGGTVLKGLPASMLEWHSNSLIQREK